MGAPPGTDVYSPVNGTIVGIEKVTIDGKVFGQRIDIQPTYAPSLIVSVSHIDADPSISTVGSDGDTWRRCFESSVSRDRLLLSRLSTQALAHYTNDAGNHVLIEVHPAATLAVG